MKKLLTSIFAAAMFAGCAYDDSSLWNKVDDHENRLKEIEQKVAKLNTDLTAVQTLVTAMQNGKMITGVTAISDGYKITFGDGTSIEVNHGMAGAAGAAGQDAPVVGVKKHTDGVYYWTIISGGVEKWLPDSDTPQLPVSGTNGVTPKMGVDADGYWTVDSGNGPVRLDPAVKAKGTDGDSFFSGVTQDDSSVTFTLADGSTFTLPKKAELSLAIQYAVPNAKVIVKWGESYELDVTQTGSFDYLISKPDGWKVEFTGTKLRITAPAQANTYAEPEGVVSFLAITSTRASHEMAKISVAAGDKSYVLYTVDFEGDYWTPFVAANYAPNAKKTSEINGGDKYTYPIWVDPNTSLSTERPLVFSGKPEWSFGYDYPWFVSSYNTNDLATYGSYKTDLYVYNPTNANSTTGGGHGGSNNFAICYGYNEPTSPYWMGDCRPVFMFLDWKPRVIKSLWINTTPYFLQEATVGSGMSNPIAPGQDVKIHATGIDENGDELSTIDLRFAWNDGTIHAIKEWTEWDLSALGPITALRLNMSGGPDNGYGFSLPAYYAVDDIAIMIE